MDREADEPRFGWRKDPFGLHEARYFSNDLPTKVVRDGSETSYDPPPEATSGGSGTSTEPPAADRTSLDTPANPADHGGPSHQSGWYGDPTGESRWRWWDGRSWTSWTSSARSDPYLVSASSEPLAAEMGMLRWAKVAVVGYPVCNVAAVSINFTLSSHWRQYFHYVHEVISNAGAIPYGEGAVTPPISSLLLTPLRLGALALFMLWLYRAASTAVALRYPAQRSPALGAWSCILPVASLWFPYQALRDCLDPNDPDRGLVARAWVLLIVTELLSTSSVLVFAEAPSLAAPFLGVLIGLAILLVVAGYRMVTVISSAHGRVIASA